MRTTGSRVRRTMAAMAAAALTTTLTSTLTAPLTAGATAAPTHLGTQLSTESTTVAATDCRVDYAVGSQWQGGFGATVTVTNLGSPVNGWQISWSFAGDERITQLWNGSHTQSGAQVNVTNAPWNGSVATGATVSFGFNGTTSTAATVPSAFSLNGVVCTGSTTTPPDDEGSAIDNNYPVTREGAYGDNRYTVFRPSNPQEVSGTMPVLAFGNGACAHTDNREVTQALTFIASKGFVVVDTGSVDGSYNGVPSGSPIPSLLTDAITWAEREQNRSGAPLAGRLDLTKVATGGHSCGGLEALVAAQDSRVSAAVSLDSGFFADGSFGYPRSELAKLHSPTLFMAGGPSDVAYDNTRANYDLVTVPAVQAQHPDAGHVGFITGNQMTDGMTTVVQFLDMVLNGNEAARAYIMDPSGLESRYPWTVARKNF